LSQEDWLVQTIFGHEDNQENYPGQMKSFQWNANDVLFNGYVRRKSMECLKAASDVIIYYNFS